MRIVPLYAVCVVGATLVAAVHRGGLAEPPGALARQIAPWFAFDFVRRPAVMGDPATLDLTGQVWTLRYEWMLYAALPLLAVGVRRTDAAWPVFVGLSLCSLACPLFAFFVAGAACAVLERIDGPVARRVWQVLGLAGLLAMVAFQHDCSGWRQAPTLVPFVVAVLQGHRGWARLGWRPLRFLGEVSYGIYLTQGFAFALTAGLLPWAGGKRGGETRAVRRADRRRHHAGDNRLPLRRAADHEAAPAVDPARARRSRRPYPPLANHSSSHLIV